MAYHIEEQDLAGFYRDGYIVFRGILPPALIRDLRRACEQARHIARREKGPQVQRLQPIAKYEGELGLQPFRDYAQLPDLVEAIQTLLTPQHRHAQLDVMGVLLEPQERPWCTKWHRDITQVSSRLEPQEFQDLMLDWDSVNQVNCPLYDDDCTWFVPGSHLRMRDLPGELAATALPGEIQSGEPEAAERACLRYAQGMPGAVQFKLHAGDFALYRPVGWHLGSYLPYKKRATLHDAVFTPKYEAWWRAWRAGGSPRWTRAVSAAA